MDVDSIPVSVFILCVIIVILLTIGEPDLLDAIISAAMSSNG